MSLRCLRQSSHVSSSCEHLLFQVRSPVFPDDLLPFSYSHLLFNPTLLLFPAAGVGLSAPPNIEDVLAPNPPPPSELGDAKEIEDLRAPFMAL